MDTIILSVLNHVIVSYIMCIVISELIIALQMVYIQGVELEYQHVYASHEQYLGHICTYLKGLLHTA